LGIAWVVFDAGAIGALIGLAKQFTNPILLKLYNHWVLFADAYGEGRELPSWRVNSDRGLTMAGESNRNVTLLRLDFVHVIAECFSMHCKACISQCHST
jgi:hypothetical protein